jgi:ferritin-like metal-binding protein YciE
MQELSLDFLQDVYYAERQAFRAYPKLVKAAESDEVKQAFTRHREETQNQIHRLEQVFEHLGKRPRGKTCQAMNGLLEEAEEAIGEMDRGPILDAALIACAQAVEHYEIARYGTMIAWARAEGNEEIVDLLQQTLDEEKRTDELLNGLAVEHVNQNAAGEDGSQGEDEEEASAAPKRAAGARRR